MYHIKNDKRSIQSAQRLYKALVELMKEKEYANITVTEMVEKAAVARATFYRNFDHIDDILKYHLDETFDLLYTYMVNYYNSTPINPLRTVFLKPFLRFWNDHSSLIELLIKANRLHLLSEGFNKIITQMLKGYKDCQEPFERLDYFKAMRTGEVISILVHWIENNKDLEPDVLADLIITQAIISMNIDLTI